MAEPINIAGDQFDTHAASLLEQHPAVLRLSVHEYQNLQDHIAYALRTAVKLERETLASALRKFAPDLAEELVKRREDSKAATDDFLRFLRTVKP